MSPIPFCFLSFLWVCMRHLVTNFTIKRNPNIFMKPVSKINIFFFSSTHGLEDKMLFTYL